MFYVLICREEDDEVLKEMPIESLRRAESVENGANINLDHENFYTKIVDESGAEV